MGLLADLPRQRHALRCLVDQKLYRKKIRPGVVERFAVRGHIRSLYRTASWSPLLGGS